MTVGWTPSSRTARGSSPGAPGPGDVALTVGAGDVDRAVPLLLEELR